MTTPTVPTATAILNNYKRITGVTLDKALESLVKVNTDTVEKVKTIGLSVAYEYTKTLNPELLNAFTTSCGNAYHDKAYALCNVVTCHNRDEHGRFAGELSASPKRIEQLRTPNNKKLEGKLIEWLLAFDVVKERAKPIKKSTDEKKAAALRAIETALRVLGSSIKVADLEKMYAATVLGLTPAATMDADGGLTDETTA